MDRVLTPEQRLARFVCCLEAPEIAGDAARVVELMLLAVSGTAVAGAGEEGIAALRRLLRERGGRPEATVLVFGDRLPAPSAALLNGVMCRALDYCDAMLPGLHIGSSLVPAAFAAAELAGGCDGATFLAALVAGAELGSRFNLTERQYDGFDPTGVAAVFAASAAAARILGLTELQTLHALALAFNRCGGSFQSNVDGSLAVRLIQGWVAETGVTCALLAREGFTGPTQFLTGIYGYAHLFGRGTLEGDTLVQGLGERWQLETMVFKKFPSCGGTQGMTQLALDMAQRFALEPQEIASLVVRVRPYTHKLVGQRFRIGANPRVDAQFSAQYCVASALVRRSCELAHFRPAAVHDPAVLDLVQRIEVESVEAMSEPGQPNVVIAVRMRDGIAHEASLQIAPGFPGNPLDDAQHRARFDDCMRDAPHPLTGGQAGRLRQGIADLRELPDVRALLHELMSESFRAA